MIYKILKAGTKTVLVHENTFDGKARDYFVGSPADARLVGEVDITGDTTYLGDIYEEDE